jgi:hypothetical protein
VRGRLTPGLVALRVTGLAALALLLWNPAGTRPAPGSARPLVLLDASLSMSGVGAHWSAALDSARAAARGGVIWRFGAGVGAFDSAPPADGMSALAPALAAAAGRGGPVVVVTDGVIGDLADVPADLLAHARVITLARSPFADAFISDVSGPHRVQPADSVRLQVTVGTAGPRWTGARAATLTVGEGTRRIASRGVALPDSGTVTADLAFAADRLPAGWSALDVRLTGVPDPEPRDDARRFVIEVTPVPAAVLLAAPPDWDARFLARALADVARVPLRTFVQAEAGRWRDAATLAPVSTDEVTRAVAAARLVVLTGDPARWREVRPRGAVLTWASGVGESGDWYVEPPGPSPIAGALAGIPWDSLPPVAAVAELPRDSGAGIVLQAALARRGAPHVVAVLRDTPPGRRADIGASGLYRWDFRGGAAGQAYRSLVAGLVDWLLAGRGENAEWALPMAWNVANGLPLEWRWTGPGAPRDLVLRLEPATGAARTDTLRFGAGGRAVLRLAPGAYRYVLADGHGTGLVAVDEYSDEWRPAATVLRTQAGDGAAARVRIDWRERGWLFLVALAAFATEWAWRRRLGLP